MPYGRVISGMLNMHIMCRQCGALIAEAPKDIPEGQVTPQMAHDRMHNAIDQLIDIVSHDGN